jgi:hypothetical protein
MTNPRKNSNVLTDAEFIETINRLGKLIPLAVGIIGQPHQKKITDHLKSIASSDILSLTDPTNSFNWAYNSKSEPSYVKFYKQLEYMLLSCRTCGYEDFYVRLCNNLVKGLVNNTISEYSINPNGGILDLATAIYKKDFVDYLVPPSKEKVLRSFLLDQPNLVIRLLIMQFYHNASN